MCIFFVQGFNIHGSGSDSESRREKEKERRREKEEQRERERERQSGDRRGKRKIKTEWGTGLRGSKSEGKK